MNKRVSMVIAALALFASCAESAFAATGQWTAAGVILSADAPAGAPATSAMRANDFLNTLGMGSHIIQGADSAAAVQAGVGYLGVRNIRDDATTNTSLISELCSIHSATGVMVDELPISSSIASTQAEYEQLAACGAFLAAEGPNEPNNFPFTYNGSTCSYTGSFGACASFQSALYSMVHGDSKLAGKQVWGMTDVGSEPDNQGLQYLTIPSGAGTIQPAGTVFADVANTHNYVEGNGSSYSTLIDNHAWDAESIPYLGSDAGDWDTIGEYWGPTWHEHYAGGSEGQDDRPKVTTETGWNLNNANIGQDAQGRLMTDVYLDAAKEGWSHTFIYTMFDSGWGAFHSNGNEGDAGNATLMGKYIHNLTTVLADTSSSFTSSSAAYSVSGAPATEHDLLMEKGNGTFELAVWGEAFASETASPVTVSLGATYPTVNVYDITSGTAPVASYSNASSIPLTLTDHAIIVEF